MKSFKLFSSLLGLAFILFSISPVYGVDFSCTGGHWVLVSNENYCSAGPFYNCIQDSCISGDTKTAYALCPMSNVGCDNNPCPIQAPLCSPNAPPADCYILTDIQVYIWQCSCTDSDGDGYYAISPTCPSGNDCDDGDVTVYPGTTEWCDGKDNNCNGDTDEQCTVEPRPEDNTGGNKPDCSISR